MWRCVGFSSLLWRCSGALVSLPLCLVGGLFGVISCVPDVGPDAPMATSPEGSALEPCGVTDFRVPAPARPTAGATEGQAALVPKGQATVRFNGRASAQASWIASRPRGLSYAYFTEGPGGTVSFALELEEGDGSRQRLTTVRLSHAWQDNGNGALCSSPRASLSIHESIDEEAVEAIPGTVQVTAFDPDKRHLGVRFEAETTAYKIFVDVDITGAGQLAPIKA